MSVIFNIWKMSFVCVHVYVHRDAAKDSANLNRMFYSKKRDVPNVVTTYRDGDFIFQHDVEFCFSIFPFIAFLFSTFSFIFINKVGGSLSPVYIIFYSRQHKKFIRMDVYITHFYFWDNISNLKYDIQFLSLN